MRRLPLALVPLVALLLAAPARPLHAQTRADTAAVRAAAMDYIDGFYTGDSTLHVRSIRPEVYKFGFWRDKDATTYAAGEQMRWPQFHAFTRRVKASGKAPEKSWPKQVKLLDVLDQTANVKVTAWWGVDYLLLGRFDGRWMITHVLWQSPPPSRKGTAKATAAR